MSILENTLVIFPVIGKGVSKQVKKKWFCECLSVTQNLYLAPKLGGKEKSPQILVVNKFVIFLEASE